MTAAATGTGQDVHADRRARLQRTVTAAASSYHEVADWDAVAVHAAQAGERVALAPGLHATHPHLATRLEGLGCTVVVPGEEHPAADVADVPVAIVAGVMAVAESGSVLVSEHALADRVVTMLCQRLVQVVAGDDVVDRLEDAAAWLAARGATAGFASLMTGPSRTADIERSLTIGVQGPDEVDVLVLVDADTTKESMS